MLELKLVAKQAGFSRIKPEGKQHVVMETPMEEPAWKKISEKLPSHLKSRFVSGPFHSQGSLKMLEFQASSNGSSDYASPPCPHPCCY